jgi:hypothetical protein
MVDPVISALTESVSNIESGDNFIPTAEGALAFNDGCL